ncbi:E3 ubiquitin-protein ligase At3g02290-like [Ipomoea triloba]|uniref:E3 ubiquitin-protein ligase At3g02290-like n=1 Tax=Ipomoea triloba TaxID=35885 RepID=UPI00125DFD4D|nr:E3 ubiquitin-protein ligase At3g02290-like [Ipomoea triloba]XP_031114990.1 E3 ubiquitin-protein ligase At3g02290-like [Ipomoea triloba]
MGAACCCLRDNMDDFADPNSSIYRNCFCLQYFVQNFFHVYTSLLHSGEHHAISSSTQATASLSSIASRDNSLSEMYCSPPRPLPYDAGHRYFHLQQNELASGREKGSSHMLDSEPLQRSDSDDDVEFPSTGNKWDESCEKKGSKEEYSRSSLKPSTTEPTTGFAHIYPSSDDEDVCPTCLEEYDEENPKIITKCSHHYHLSCIYEWMERSDTCPVCGKVMAFDERI